ncbi:MAG: DMT family transporter [Pseudomonadota bacterium]
MEAWVLITIAAAFLQNARSALQRVLKGRLGGAGATFVRFGFGLPFAALYAAAVWSWQGAVPGPTAPWALFLTLGAIAQILATAALLASFSNENFAVGTAYSKTEPIQAAVFGAVLLGEAPSAMASLAIAVGVAGVVLMSWKPGGDGSGLRRYLGPAALLGLGSAALFGVSAAAYRAASLSLTEGDAMIRAATTLVAATAVQTVLMGAWMAWRAPKELRAVGAAWRPGLLVGFCGAAASAGWFTAMTLEPVAHVRALGQVEILFTVLVSAFVFRERPSARDLFGVALVVLGVLLLLRATGGLAL